MENHNPSPARGRCALLLLLLLTSGPAAEIKVGGMGWLDSRQAQNTLPLLLGEQTDGPMSASAIEDASLILFSQLAGDGYLDPQLTVAVTLEDGREAEYTLNTRLDEPLPRPLSARVVRFQVERGPQLHFRAITFTGLQTIPEEIARDFFVGETMLIPLQSTRVYSPGRLNRALGNLEEELRQQGYAEASVTLADRQIDRASGAVDVSVDVNEGRPWVIGSLRFEITDGSVPPSVTPPGAEARWTSLWRQNLSTEIRRWYFERGFPDVSINLVPETGPPTDGRRTVEVVIHVEPGPSVRLGQVQITGNEHTRSSVLHRLVSLHPGEPLNPIALDNAQARMSRLGIFNSVELRYEPADGVVRDAVFTVAEGRRKELNLLFGYGSYEQFRGGVELNNFNVLGRAHTSSLKLVQSMKSTQGEHLYTVPELFGSTVDGSTRLFGLRREELSFRREEYGATLSLLWPLGGAGSLTTGYTFRHLRSTNSELATRGTDDTQTDAASVEAGWLFDRLDNPLTPRHGYKLFSHLEEASRYLGGQVEYQRFLFDASYHTNWGRNRWVHAGFTHAFITTLGADDDHDLPVNIRYFPGGDGSIRGYQNGEAAPRNAAGEFIGAKSYLQVNLELEQALTRKFSVVLFVDALGTAVRLADYPFSERLYSTGLGFRYHTLIGPVRLEYGHNLNPRPFDPSGTLLLSVGFPF